MQKDLLFKDYYEAYRGTARVESKNGEVLTVSAQELRSDVQRVMSELHAESRYNTVAVYSDNTYPDLVTVLASVLCGKSLCLIPKDMDPVDIEEVGALSIQESIDLLGKRFGLLNLDAAEDGLRIIAFTSGSTGSIPKCICVELDRAFAFARSVSETYGIDESDNWCICGNFSHIVHFEYLIAAIVIGASITLCSNSLVLKRPRIVRPTVLITIPSFYKNLDSVLEIRKQDARTFFGAGLKYFVIGAAPTEQALIESLVGKNLPLYEGYGTSETQMISCNTAKQNLTGSCGPSWPGINIEIAPDGEILVSSTSTPFSSYLGEPASESFNTGDLGYVDEDGFLHVTGRKKNVIILSSGKKIIPEFVEKKVCRFVTDESYVLSLDNRKLTLAVLCEGNVSADIAESLGRYNLLVQEEQRIDSVLFLTPMPDMLTSTGKIKRSMLLTIAQSYKTALIKL